MIINIIIIIISRSHYLAQAILVACGIFVPSSVEPYKWKVTASTAFTEAHRAPGSARRPALKSLVLQSLIVGRGPGAPSRGARGVHRAARPPRPQRRAVQDGCASELRRLASDGPVALCIGGTRRRRSFRDGSTGVAGRRLARRNHPASCRRCCRLRASLPDEGPAVQARLATTRVVRA